MAACTSILIDVASFIDYALGLIVGLTRNLTLALGPDSGDGAYWNALMTLDATQS